MATKALGTNYQNVVGWAKAEETPQESGEKVVIFRGALVNLGAALSAIKADDTLIYDDVKIDTDAESGTATITLTKSPTTTTSKPGNDQVKNPTVSIQGSMLSPQLHQHPFFSQGEKPLTLSAIATVNYCLKNYGEVAAADLERESNAALIYAQWRSYGIDTYLAPTYTMNITYYLSSTAKITDFIEVAGKVFKFDTVINRLPKDKQPPDISVPAWLAQAPSINITSDGITVTQSFVGATAFPSFYATEDKTLVYDAPQLSDEYFYDLKHKRENSGTEG